MSAFSRIRTAAVLIGFGLGSVVLAADPDELVEIERQRVLLRLRLAQMQLELAQKQKNPPKGKAAPKPVPVPAPPSAAMPDGAIARLGNTRLRHAAPATCVVFSPDSKRIISGGEDGALRVWDAATGEHLQALASSAAPTAAYFTHDGSRFATAVDFTNIHFFDAATLKPIATFTAGDAQDFTVSKDGRLIAVLDNNSLLTVTEIESGLQKIELQADTSRAVDAPMPRVEGGGKPTSSRPRFAFRPDGRSIAVADQTGKVTLYMLAGGKPMATFDHGGPVNGLLFSPDGKQLVTGGAATEEVVKVWDIDAAPKGKSAKPAAEIKGISRPKAWFGDGRIAAAGREGAGIFDLASQKWAHLIKGAGGEWAVAPDGTKLAAAGGGSLRVRVWDLADGKQLFANNDTFPDAALLAPSADGKSVFILADNSASHWALDRPVATAAGQLPARAVTAAAAGGRLAVATPDSILIYDDFDPAKGVAKPSRRLADTVAAPRVIAVSPDGKRVAFSHQTGETGRTAIADAGTGKTLRVLPTKALGQALAFSPDGTRLGMIARDGFLALWPVETPDGDDTDIWRVRVQRGIRAAVAFSPDGQLVAATSASQMRIVNAKTGEAVFELDRRDIDDGAFQHAAFSPDSRLLITGSAGLTGAIHVHEVATRSLVRRWTTNFGAINRLVLCPNGSRAISAGAEESITAWDLSFRHGKAPPSQEELAAAWADLESVDAAKGYSALRTLVAAGGTRPIAAGLASTVENRKKIAAWIKGLEAEEFADREAAAKALLDGGYQALLALKEAAARSDSAEMRARAIEIVKKLTAKDLTIPAHGLVGDNLRLIRAVQVLESIGGPEARALVVKIASIAGPDDRAATDAKAALKRMK